MKNKVILILLITVLLIGSFLRLFTLSKSPPSLDWDEAALGYNAYSLYKTGEDEYGFKYPLTLRSFDDYKPALYSYMTIPFIATLGLNEFSVRILSALSGISTILAVFFIAKKLFNEKVGLLSSFFIAIEPWAVHFSRVAFEANLALALTLWGIVFALYANRKYLYILLSIFLLILSAYTYHANKILFLPIIVTAIFYNKKFITKQKLINITVFSAVLIIPLILTLTGGGGATRLESTSILRAVNLKASIDPFTIVDEGYNLLINLTGRYFAYFSPVNLFVRGVNEPNQMVHGFGIFYNIEFIFFLLGFWQIIKKKFKPRSLSFLIFLSPIPAIITWNWFSPVRTLLLFSIYSIIIGLGAFYLLEFIKSRKKLLKILISTFLGLLILNNIGNLATSVFLYTPYAEKGNWQFGFREIMNYIKPIEGNYHQIIFETGQAQPHIFVLFYSQYDPAEYHKDIVCPTCVPIPRKNFDFGKFHFRRIYWPDDRSLKDTLFIGSTFSLPENDIKNTPNAKILRDVTDRWGDFVARIVATN